MLTPKLRAAYLSETVQDYPVSNGKSDVLEIKGSTTEQLRVSVGGEVAHRISMPDGGTFTPKLGMTGGFSGLGGQGAFGQASAGMSYNGGKTRQLNLGLQFGVEGSGQKSASAKLGIAGKF